MQQSGFAVNTLYHVIEVTVMALVSMPQTTPEKDEKGRYGSFYLKGYWSTHGIGSRFKDNSGKKKTSGQWKEFFTFQERLIIEYNVIVQSCFEHGYKTRSPEEVDAGMRRAILMVHDQGFCEQKRMLEGEKQEKNRVQRNVAMVDAQKANPGTHFHTVAEPASGDAQLKIIKTGYEIHRCILSDLIHTSGLAKTDPGWLREALDAIFFVTSYNSVGDKSIPLLINKKNIQHIPGKERKIFIESRFFELAELSFANRESLADSMESADWLYLPTKEVHDDHLHSDPFLAMALRCKAIEDGQPWQPEDIDLGYKVLEPMFAHALKRHAQGWGFACLDNRYKPDAATYKKYLESGTSLHHRGLDPVAYAQVNHLCDPEVTNNLYQSPVSSAIQSEKTDEKPVEDGDEFMVMTN